MTVDRIESGVIICSDSAGNMYNAVCGKSCGELHEGDIVTAERTNGIIYAVKILADETERKKEYLSGKFMRIIKSRR